MRGEEMNRIVVGDLVNIAFNGGGKLDNVTVNYVPMSREDNWIVTNTGGTFYIHNCEYVFKSNRSNK
jgi:hypothetical protein